MNRSTGAAIAVALFSCLVSVLLLFWERKAEERASAEEKRANLEASRAQAQTDRANAAEQLTSFVLGQSLRDQQTRESAAKALNNTKGAAAKNTAEVLHRDPQESDLRKASNEADPSPKTALGETYLRGNGVLKDEVKGISLLREAVAENDARAMNCLGDYLVRCAGKLTGGAQEKDYKEAFELFSKAKDLGCLDAIGNLGVLYMNGTALDRQSPDSRKGVSLFCEGAKKGNPSCMRYYATCLEDGIGVKPNRLEAESWYVNAAKLGDKGAIEWCKSHHVTIAPDTAL